MGNNHSVPLEQATKEQVIERVKSLGEKFHAYASDIDENGVDGDLLAGMNEDDLMETLDDLGITSRLHRRKLMQEFRRACDDMTCCSSVGGSETGVALPANGPVDEVLIKEIVIRPQYYPSPDELDANGETRTTHELPLYQDLRSTEDHDRDDLGHLADDFFAAADSIPGAHRPPIPADDMERVAQVDSYGLEELEPNSEAAHTLTGYVEMATKLFGFDFGDITFFDNKSQFSFARVGLTQEIKDAIIGPIYHPVNFAEPESPFLCKTDRSIGLCNYPTSSKRTFVAHDLHADDTFKWLSGAWPFRCYAGTPLLSPSGLVLGVFCLHNLEPRPDFGKAHEIQLEQVGRMVVQAIENWSLRRRIHQLETERRLSQTSANKENPPTESAVLVQTTIEGLAQLQKVAPEALKEAQTLHDQILRKELNDHFGHEVECNASTSSFVLAFHDAVDAFSFALQLQKQLYDAPWSKDLLACPQASDDPEKALRGLRVRVGVHSGDVPTGENNYAGPTMELTRSIEAMGYGGQILTTFDTWNAASFLAETKLESPQVVDLGTHVAPKGRKLSDGVTSKRILQLVPANLAIQYHNHSESSTKETATTTNNNNPAKGGGGRQFPDLKSLKKLSKSFFDAPAGQEVCIAFIGCSEIENRYKESASIIAEIIGHASSLLPGSQGYQCQNNMFAFPNVTEAVKFGIRFLDLMRSQKPLEDGAEIARVVTFGCVQGTFVALEPHKTTGRADYFGKVVNRAARVSYSAQLGKVCVGVTSEDGSDQTLELKDPNIDVKFVGMKQLKGVEEEMAIYESKKKRSMGQIALRWFGANTEL